MIAVVQPRLAERTSALSPSAVAWRPVLTIAVAVVAVLLPFAGSYGYHADELYFRLLGERGPAWGYVDQPPLLPLLVDASASVFGDSLRAIRVPAMLCAAAVVVLGSLITAELGGSPRAQVLTALGLAPSMLVLTFGHWMLTSSVDIVAWCALLLFVLRALLRGGGRWWLAAGAVGGLALYAKHVILLAPITLFLGLLMVGPRWHLRKGWIYGGAAIGIVIGAPNLLYQLANDLPQLQMAGALGELDGSANRQLFLTNLIFLLGPGLVPFWIAGLLGTFRKRAWRPVRALGAAYLIAVVASIFVEGGRPDYSAGFLVALFAAGCVRADGWLGTRRLRLGVVAVGLAVTSALQALLALPVIPERTLADFPINSMALETVGWPTFVDQVAQVHAGLDDAERERAVLLVDNFGLAGALDRYGERHELPEVYSGHNELHRWGPPPESADVVIAVGIGAARLAEDFADCRVETRLDNGLEIDNPEQGKDVLVCSQRQAPWGEIWPAYRHLGAYQ